MKRRNVLSAVLATVALLALTGVSYAQFGAGGPPGRGGPGGRRGGGGGLGMLRMPQVQKELGLTQAQIKKLEALPRAGGRGQNLQNMTDAQRRKWFEDRRKQRDRQIASVLNPKQLARYRQLELQRSGYRALAQKEVADRLKLTSAQRRRVQKTLDSDRAAMRKIGESMRGGSAGGGGFERFRKQRAATDSALKGILTAGQRAQFAAMLGKPFKFPEFGRGGRGGGRGPRGGRPGGRPGTAT